MEKDKKVLEFKTREQLDAEEENEKAGMYFEEFLTQYMESIGVEKLDTFENLEGLKAEIKRLEEQENLKFVFESEEMAVIMIKFLLNQPENSNISHYEIIPCFSRAALFFEIKPVPKTDTKFIFLNEKMRNTLNVDAMKNFAKEMAQEKEEFPFEDDEDDE